MRSLLKIFQHTNLIKQLTIREVNGRYKGSYLGVLWSFITPILMLTIYTFVFSVIFEARWGVHNTNKVEFAMLLFCGLVAFNIFAEIVSRAPGLIINNANYVKKVVFPLEILPIVAVNSALVHGLIGIFVLLIALIIFMGTLHWTILFIPLVLLPLILLSLGLAWLLSSLGVFLRDIGQVISIAVTGFLFLSPIFYPISSIPVSLQYLFYINPISYVVEDMRRVVVWGQQPDWFWLLIGIVIGLLVLLAGFFWFEKSKKTFSDVL